MKTFVAAFVAVLAVANAFPKPENTISYIDENGNTITEDLDQPMPTPYAVSMGKLDFMLYTRANSKNPCKMTLGDVSSVKNCGFISTAATKVLIHGWQNNYDTESVQIIKDAYLAKSNVNVLIFGYKEYNSPYISAVSSAKTVGESLAQFLKFLADSGYVKLSELHIIGHSLGAHISGFCAQALPTQVARITGLDPAGPLFGGKKPDGRLSSDDAKYVDVMHTSTAFGLNEAIGAADFWPNGGENQPECTHALSSGGCDHASSYRYLSQSIADHDTFPALKCSTLADAQDKDTAPSKCASGQARMGENAPATAPSGNFYVGV